MKKKAADEVLGGGNMSALLYKILMLTPKFNSP